MDKAGNVERYECCDELILAGHRSLEQCEPSCPWEQVLPFSYFIGGLFAGACTGTKDHKGIVQYALDPQRFPLAMKLHDVPEEEWAEAWRWISLCLSVLNE